MHRIPVKVNNRQCGHVVSHCLSAVRVGIGAGVGRYRLSGAGGPLPIIHHLGQCRGHTTCMGMLARWQIGQQDVVRVVLAPCGLDQRPDGACRFELRRKFGSVGQRLNLVGIAVEKLLHGLGHILGIKVALVAVAQHGRGAVVTGNDDITAAVGVEHIVGCILAASLSSDAGRLSGLGQSCRWHRVRGHEIGGNATSLSLVNRLGPSGGHHCQTHQ